MESLKKRSTKKKIYKHSLSESQIQSKYIKHLKTLHTDAFIVKLSDKWVSGLPDLLMVVGGKAYFYEIKSKNGVVSKIQEQTMIALQKSGAIVNIVRGGE